MSQQRSLLPSIRVLLSLVTMSVANLLTVSNSTADDSLSLRRLRRPIAMAVANDGKQLYVANRDSGSVSTIDVSTARVTSEIDIGKRLSDLTISPDGHWLLAVDEVANELIVLECRPSSLERVFKSGYDGLPRSSPTGKRRFSTALESHRTVRLPFEDTVLEPVARLATSHSPVSISISADGSRSFVACLWSRRLATYDLSDPREPVPMGFIDLPFAPRMQRLLPDGKTLVVADAFGGRLAVIDIVQGNLMATRQLEGHNLLGLAVSSDGRSLHMPHQILHRENATTHAGVHWGGVMLNVIRSVRVASLLEEQVGPPAPGGLYYLGFPDRATGDPTDILITREGRQILLYAGVSEIAISDLGVNYFKRTAVGRRPTALAFSSDQSHVYVANTFSDSISIVDVESAEVVKEISLGPPAELGLADRGEMLFHDSRLSSDGWYSCHSCHPDGHSNGLLNDNFSDGTYGAPKRVLSLLGVADTGPWAWNGGAGALDDQIRKSIETTMQGPAPTDGQVRAIAAYLKTLRPAPSLARARGQVNKSAIARGRAVFERYGCSDCHQPHTYTTSGIYDVDLEDEAGNTEFNPPSLRGVSQSDRLFHDNRASDLRAVLVEFQHGLDEPLAGRELDELIIFLQSL